MEGDLNPHGEFHPAYDCVTDATGDTPLVRIDGLLAPATGYPVWAKLESFNPSGSAKDRTAKAMVDDAVAAGFLRPGSVAVESSSGNLGVALARLSTLGGWEFHCVVDQRTNSSTLAHMKALGATVHQITAPDPETGDWLIARRNRVAELVEELGAINFDQYSNQAAFRAHEEGTMTEIAAALDHAPDHLYVAVSTTGTIGGCQRWLRAHDAATRVVAVDSVGSVLFDGERGTRLLPGYGAGTVTGLSRQVTPDTVQRMSPAQAVDGARRLARTTAILPGASGGAVVAAYLDDVRTGAVRPGEETVLVLHDEGTAYLDTIYDDDWVHENIAPTWQENNQ